MKDPIVDEVRAARRKHAQRFNFDLHSICADLKKKEKEYGQKYGHPIKSLPPKSVQTAAANNSST
ncbi:hypothetical protein GWO43_27950 [candidate division KSB1 bacterium]|nr:hypothetical protein [candidate division KSB1 bacterium]NIV69421.1 hypothetical protein [Phycisphaerae bacterium]NIR70719.1 hypothetical protein [candidate division KSB1 bacterium]NIS27776.1 hypothetical protein [candidate division KSB1 bacterium]NIT74624.1 hypothetical protein [candidate division KSB1 bacterium]